MNGTVPEEAGKVAVSTVEAMKGQPALIAVIILAALGAFGTMWAWQKESDRQQERLTTLVQLLDRCYPDEGHP